MNELSPSVTEYARIYSAINISHTKQQRKKREPLTMNKAKAHTHTQNSVTEKERKKHVPNGICTIVRTLAAFDIGFDYSDP